jgi:hypothetical protein
MTLHPIPLNFLKNRKICFSFLSVHVFPWIQSLHSGVSFWKCNILIEIYFCPNATFHIWRLFWRSFFLDYILCYECKISSKYLLGWNVSRRIFERSASFRVIFLKALHFHTKTFCLGVLFFRLGCFLGECKNAKVFCKMSIMCMIFKVQHLERNNIEEEHF